MNIPEIHPGAGWLMSSGRSGSNARDRQRYLAEFGDEEVAIVLFGSFAEHAIAWFNGEVPALEERTPADVLQNEPQGLRIIESLLMRLPR